MKDLTPEQLTAVSAFARLHGRRWKVHLRVQWEWARATPILQALRNSHGPAWLATYRLVRPALPHPLDDAQARDAAPRWVETNGPAQEVPEPAVQVDPSPGSRNGATRQQRCARHRRLTRRRPVRRLRRCLAYR